MEPFSAAATATTLFSTLWGVTATLNAFFSDCKHAPVRVRSIKVRLDSCYDILKKLERAQHVESECHQSGSRHDDFQLKDQVQSFLVLCERLARKVEPLTHTKKIFLKRAFFLAQWKWTRKEITDLEDQLRMHESSLIARLTTTM